MGLGPPLFPHRRFFCHETRQLDRRRCLGLFRCNGDHRCIFRLISGRPALVRARDFCRWCSAWPWPCFVWVSPLLIGATKMKVKPKKDPSISPNPSRRRWPFIVYIICFGYLGFVVSTAIFMIIYLLWVEVRSVRLSLIVSLSVTVVTYVIFVEFLGVDLPLGVVEGVVEGVREWIS